MKLKNVLSQIATGLIEAIIITVCSLLVVRNVCFETIVVSGSSMNPTLQSGDYGYCDKTKHTLDNINRFDIIIFEYDSNGDGKKEELIKRVIGLPNENIYFDDEEKLFKSSELAKKVYETINMIECGEDGFSYDLFSNDELQQCITDIYKFMLKDKIEF